MPRVRAQVVLQGATNIPEDRFVNVFHFDSPAVDLEMAGFDLAGPLHQFYGDQAATIPGDGVGRILSEFVVRPYEIRWYNLDEPEGSRVPEITPGLLPAYTSSTNGDLPEEMAVCLSLEGPPPVTPRKRGRLYFGPLKAETRVDATTTVPTRVNGSTLADLATWATRLMLQAPTWC